MYIQALKYSILIVILFILTLPRVSYSQWQRIATVDLGITSIYFLPGACTPTVGFLGTPGWNIYRTSNGGKTWTKVKTLPGGQYYVSSFTFKDSMTGWCSLNELAQGPAFTNAVYKTTDGGLTWNALNIQGDFPSIYYNKTTQRLYLSSWVGPNKYSTDDGNTWQDLAAPRNCSFAFLSDQDGILSAVEGSELLYTHDAGLTWQRSNFTFEAYQPLALPCDKVYYQASETQSTIYKSTNGGSAWVPLATIQGRYLTGSIQGDLNHLFIQTNLDVMTSTDQGVTWRSINGPPNNVDHQMLSFNGYLYAADPQGGLWVCRFDSTETVSRLLVSPLTLNYVNEDCNVVRIGTNNPCNGCVESISLEQITLTGSPNYTITYAPRTPSTFLGSDSIVIFRFGSDPNSDSAKLTIRYKIGNRIADTIVTIKGSGDIHRALNLSNDTISFFTTACGITRDKIIFSGLPSGGCGDSLKITAISLTGDTTFKIEKLPKLPLTITGRSDSINLIHLLGIAPTESALLRIRLSQHGRTVDTTIVLQASNATQQSARLGITTSLNRQDFTGVAGDTVTAVVQFRTPVARAVNLQNVFVRISFGENILTPINPSSVAVTPSNGWSIVNLTIGPKAIDVELNHAPYNIPQGEEIVRASFFLAISDTLTSQIWLSEVMFNPADSTFEDCVLHSSLSLDTVKVTEFLTDCGDLTIHSFMRGELSQTLVLEQPNPVLGNRQSITVTFISDHTTVAAMRLFDVSGNMIANKTAELRIGTSTTDMNIANLISGTYILEVSIGRECIRKKVLIQR